MERVYPVYHQFILLRFLLRVECNIDKTIGFLIIVFVEEFSKSYYFNGFSHQLFVFLWFQSPAVNRGVKIL